MGLDMYFTNKVNIFAQYEFSGITGRIHLRRKGEKISIPLNKVETIILIEGSLRKANAVHQWLVDNIQDGNDDCKEYYFPIESRNELRDLIVEIQKNPDTAHTCLPIQDGFFFGNNENPYNPDAYYWEYLQETLDILNGIHQDEDSIYYQSSW